MTTQKEMLASLLAKIDAQDAKIAALAAAGNVPATPAVPNAKPTAAHIAEIVEINPIVIGEIPTGKLSIAPAQNARDPHAMRVAGTHVAKMTDSTFRLCVPFADLRKVGIGRTFGYAMGGARDTDVVAKQYGKTGLTPHVWDETLMLDITPANVAMVQRVLDQLSQAVATVSAAL